MRAALPFVAAFCLSGLAVGPASGAGPADPGTPVGSWLTEDRDAVIAIEPCRAALCGSIVGMRLQPQEPIPTDYQGRSQCGLRIIHDALPSGGGTWSARIVDPRDGTAYRARIHLDRENRLHLRGYIGIPLLGRTQVWTRFEPALPASCRLPTP